MSEVDGIATDREAVEAAWVANAGPSCTSAALLAALGLLGVTGLPGLEAGTRELAGAPFAAPALLDYVGLPGRRAPLDRRVEALGGRLGAAVQSRTRLAVPGRPPATPPGWVTVAHLAWGQERPGVYGSWGFRLLERASWDTGGHSVVLLTGGRGSWRVLDPNHPLIQEWPRPGVAVTVTRIRRGPAPRPG